MSDIILRDFATEDNGYHNAALGIAGVAVAFPVGAAGALVSVSAGCFLSVRGDATLVAWTDALHGSVLNGFPVRIRRTPMTDDTHIHIAPWSGTAAVAIAFF